MRLFTGLELPAETLANLGRLLKDLRPAAQVRWTHVENLHVTTKFIGEWPVARLEELKQVLAGLPPREPIELSLRGLGYFPNPHHPRVFWVAVQAGPTLAALAHDTEQALSTLGVSLENRPFSAHLTLARIPDRTPLLGLKQAVAGLPSVEFGSFTADRFFLYLSERGEGGSVYSRLAEFPFRKNSA